MTTKAILALLGAITLETEGTRITGIYALRNPKKLARLVSAVSFSRGSSASA